MEPLVSVHLGITVPANQVPGVLGVMATALQAAASDATLSYASLSVSLVEDEEDGAPEVPPSGD